MHAYLSYSAIFGIGPERDHPGYVVAAGSGAGIARSLRAGGHHVVTVEEEGGEALHDDGPLSGATVLSVPGVQQQLRDLRVTAVVPFKPSERLSSVAEEAGLGVLASPPRLVRQLENKLSLPLLAETVRVRVPATHKVVLDDTLADQAADLGVRFPAVFQPAVGFAGAGTTLVEDAGALGALVGERPMVGKLVELVEGEPLTVSGVVLGDQPDDVLVGPVGRQLTGIPACTPRRFGACGNDYALPLDAGVTQAARTATLGIGTSLAVRGFVGFFGVDLVATPAGDCLVIEVNPRFTAGMSLQVQLQQLGDGPTLYDAHLHAFGAAQADRDALVARFGFDADPEPGDGASVLLFNPFDTAAAVEDVPHGIYSLDDGGELVFRRDGYRLDQLRDDRELLVLPQPPARPIGGEIARVIVRGPALATGDGRTLAPRLATAVDSLARRLAPRPATAARQPASP